MWLLLVEVNCRAKGATGGADRFSIKLSRIRSASLQSESDIVYDRKYKDITQKCNKTFNSENHLKPGMSTLFPAYDVIPVVLSHDRKTENTADILGLFFKF